MSVGAATYMAHCSLPRVRVRLATTAAARSGGPGLQAPTLAEIVTAPPLVGDTRQVGAELLRTHLAIAAPSAVNPQERNVVISPAHPDFDRVVPGAIRPFVFDRRLPVE